MTRDLQSIFLDIKKSKKNTNTSDNRHQNVGSVMQIWHIVEAPADKYDLVSPPTIWW